MYMTLEVSFSGKSIFLGKSGTKLEYPIGGREHGPINMKRSTGTAMEMSIIFLRRSHFPNVMYGRKMMAAGIPKTKPPAWEEWRVGFM
jgi:hypothetical protein